MAGMFVCSTDTFAAPQTQQAFWPVVHAVAPQLSYPQYRRLHGRTRKAAHLLEYALLATLLLRACRAGAVEAWHWRWATCSLVLVALHAGLDEYHQTYTRYRTGAVSDSVLDLTGALLALGLLWLTRRQRARLDLHGAG
jgi:VanZ family protein